MGWPPPWPRRDEEKGGQAVGGGDNPSHLDSSPGDLGTNRREGSGVMIPCVRTQSLGDRWLHLQLENQAPA